MALRGTIDTMSVADLLDWMDRRAASGVLTLTRATVARRFQISAGAITLASSSEQRVLLGRLLMERKLIRPTELERALRIGRETGTRLGRVLTLIELVSEEKIRELLREKIQAMIANALGWTDGRFVFDDNAEAQQPMVRLSLALRDVLIGARRSPAEIALAGGV
jgi:hypothetical protein